MCIKICLTNLGKYNEGELVFEWLSLPATEEEVEDVKEAIGINEEYEEWFISDYESEIPGVTVHEYENIEKLNEVVEQLERLDKYELMAFRAFLENGDDLEEAVEHVKEGDYILWLGCDDMRDVAEQYADECGLLDKVPEDLRGYFDFEAYGRDLGINGTFVGVDDGYVEIL